MEGVGPTGPTSKNPLQYALLPDRKTVTSSDAVPGSLTTY